MNIFNNPQHEQLFLEHGYFQTPFLDEAGVAGLRSTIESVFSQVGTPFEWSDRNFQFTGIHSDMDFVERLYHALTDYMRPHLDSLFVDYMQVMAGVFNKPARTTDSDLRTHQDPTFVELPYRTVIVWVPLVDVVKENGACGLLPGSQHLYAYRPMVQPPIFEGCREALMHKYGELIESQAGQALVFDTGLIHWSWPNLSDRARPAIQFVNVPRQAPFFYCHYQDSDEKKSIELYQMPADRVRTFPWFRRERPSSYPLLKSFEYEYEEMSEAELVRKVAPYNAKVRALAHSATPAAVRPGLFRRLQALIR